jgi:ADP-heptose:LPS heptosyltransferase
LKKIILSRTDSIGDVVLTLPLAGLLKELFPGIHICFLGRSYTRPVIEACRYVDTFLDWDAFSDIQDFRVLHADAILHVFPVRIIAQLAKEAGIPLRVGTSHRWYNWIYCNRLVHYSRKRSNLHEAKLNLKLLKGIGIRRELSLHEIPGYYGLTPPPLPLPLQGRGPGGGVNLILHPKSKGSAREWGLGNFSKLIRLLPEDRFNIFITGTKEEGGRMQEFLSAHAGRVTDMTGKLSLGELMAFIDSCDAMVAASTGPLHLAAALGKQAIGLYAPMRPIFPQRWAPLGKNADWLVLDKKCSKCRKSMDCECIRSILPEEVAGKLMSGK